MGEYEHISHVVHYDRHSGHTNSGHSSCRGEKDGYHDECATQIDGT